MKMGVLGGPRVAVFRLGVFAVGGSGWTFGLGCARVSCLRVRVALVRAEGTEHDPPEDGLRGHSVGCGCGGPAPSQ